MGWKLGKELAEGDSIRGLGRVERVEPKGNGDSEIITSTKGGVTDGGTVGAYTWHETS